MGKAEHLEKPTLSTLEKLVETYAAARGQLAEHVGSLTSKIDALKRQHIREIRACVAVCKDAEAALRASVAAVPELFEKPRSRTFHGIKIGYQKAKGTVTFADEAAVIKRIRAQLPKDQAELLVRVEEKVHKPAVYDLSAADLKRLGIEITGAGDVVFVKDTASEVDALVSALLKESAEEEAEH
jgi:hypothetical protein